MVALALKSQFSVGPNNWLTYVTEFNETGEADHDQAKRGKESAYMAGSRGHKLEPDVIIDMAVAC